ncbi:DUF3833 family protein [Pseudomonas sp. JS3066]|uniref:DUF3833 family protein n=2 Tax=unclassified Pseudomonas TaxID=196821 RepID=UPI000EAA905E|nr:MULTISPECIES: DUF3833 family protein [unclassified Pseudomonas]AYF86780.1 DUF3833 family protein [Pseudomonas sp. DY-1]MDH4653683.1 DUF3833 family protein [Pseudomonas sp. BN606]MRK21970.1 DUF3833 family protein [Pseudomonas sp. JG-B]WVK95748.1 DUF3833 family protein [Pseudomonas sp. JS3066]
MSLLLDAWRRHSRLIPPMDVPTFELSVDDWMYLVDKVTPINRSNVCRLGMELGRVTLLLCRQPGGQGG